MKAASTQNDAIIQVEKMESVEVLKSSCGMSIDEDDVMTHSKEATTKNDSKDRIISTRRMEFNSSMEMTRTFSYSIVRIENTSNATRSGIVNELMYDNASRSIFNKSLSLHSAEDFMDEDFFDGIVPK